MFMLYSFGRQLQLDNMYRLLHDGYTGFKNAQADLQVPRRLHRTVGSCKRRPVGVREDAAHEQSRCQLGGSGKIITTYATLYLFVLSTVSRVPLQDGLTPLMAAICGGNVEVVKLILRHGANINSITVVCTVYVEAVDVWHCMHTSLIVII